MKLTDQSFIKIAYYSLKNGFNFSYDDFNRLNPCIR